MTTFRHRATVDQRLPPACRAYDYRLTHTHVRVCHATLTMPTRACAVRPTMSTPTRVWVRRATPLRPTTRPSVRSGQGRTRGLGGFGHLYTVDQRMPPADVRLSTDAHAHVCRVANDAHARAMRPRRRRRPYKTRASTVWLATTTPTCARAPCGRVSDDVDAPHPMPCPRARAP